MTYRSVSKLRSHLKLYKDDSSVCSKYTSGTYYQTNIYSNKINSNLFTIQSLCLFTSLVSVSSSCVRYIAHLSRMHQSQIWVFGIKMCNYHEKSETIKEVHIRFEGRALIYYLTICILTKLSGTLRYSNVSSTLI